MLIRISLIIAIIAALAAGTLNFIKVRQIIIDTRAERDKWHGQYDQTFAELNKTKKDLATTKATLDQTTKDLNQSKKDLAAAVAAKADLEKQAATLKENLSKTDAELTDAKIELDKYHAAFPTPGQALSVSKDMKAIQDRMDVVEDEKKVLQRQLVRVQNELNIYKNPDHPVELPATLVGKVLVSDPKWDFVVLSVGEEQGAQPHGEMLVNRDGKLVAKIRITSVQKDRSIANVLPGWKLGEVMEGDQVIPAYPSQS